MSFFQIVADLQKRFQYYLLKKICVSVMFKGQQ